MQSGRDAEKAKVTPDKEHRSPRGVEVIDSMAWSANGSLAQAACTRAIVGEIGKVSKGSDHKVPFTSHSGICNACGRHDFIHTMNGKVV